MTKSIYNDFRKRILHAVSEGMSVRAAAIRYDVSESVAVKLIQLLKKHADLERS